MTDDADTAADRWVDREFRFEPQMTDAEALMWSVEKDPWLNPSGATVVILDRPMDFDQFRNRMRWAVARVPRLRQKVVPSVGRLAPPQWRTDPEFNFDHHVRHIALPSPGGRRQLLDLATRLYEDPFDRTRPLWQFVVIDGLEGGQGAIFWKMHHSIADGTGLVRLAELYLEVERSAPEPPEVDLVEVLAASLADEGTTTPDHHGEDGDKHSGAASVRSVKGSVGHLVRRQAGLARRALGEMALWGADPVRPFDQAASLMGEAQSTLDELRGSDQDRTGGSPIWRTRSRGREFNVMSVDLEASLAAARRMGGSLNDLLLTAVADAAHHYHSDNGVDIELLNASFIISTRSDDAVGGNSFSPTRVQLPAGKMPLGKRFDQVHTLVDDKREALGTSNALANLAAVASRLPTSVISRFVRQQAASIDVATSNFRAAPFTVYMSGAKVLENFILGPVAGTACNVTAMSYDGTLFIGIMSDPAAIDDPISFRANIEAAFAAALEG